LKPSGRSHLDKSLLIPFSSCSDSELEQLLRKYRFNLTVYEARRVVELLGRDPTRIEATIFNVMWSEHCSYKSSKAILRRHLPVEAPNVVLSVTEDAGIVELAEVDGRRYGLVIGHESHNHPSQVVPMEGAATGIGGIIRDVYCMGAEVVGVLDALRFGDPLGPNGERVREIAQGVIDGIWRYGNPVGLPNLGGDVLFDSTYDDNCLVNVVAVGVVPVDRITHSRVPEAAEREPYDVVLVGKPTDDSGFGGAAFASEILDEQDEVENRGAIQVPDPFLKRVLTEATKVVLDEVEKLGLEIGFKDLGAGGIACATSEMSAAGGFGIEIDLEKIPVSMDIPPEVVSCSETQERYCFIVPRRFSERICDIFNNQFELPSIYEGARAAVIGSVARHGRYIIREKGKVQVDTDINTITSGISYDREKRPRKRRLEQPDPAPEVDLSETLLALLGSPNGSSREYVYRHYDTGVKGLTVLAPGEADAGVIAPLPGNPVGLAVSVDGNPYYGEVDPFWGGALAVVEAMMNVAAVGAKPVCLTDCLNFGNPEDPEVMYDFEEAVKGIAWAAREVGSLVHPGSPVPVVSGNVSFYNESTGGKAILPSPIICCVGLLPDYSRVVSQSLKQPGSYLVMVGERGNELGGSLFYRWVHGVAGSEVPRPAAGAVRALLETAVGLIDRGLVLACHDISAGGLAVALAEMMLVAPGDVSPGVDLKLQALPAGVSAVNYLFSESPGFVMEVAPERVTEVLEAISGFGLEPVVLGRTTGKPTFLWEIPGLGSGEVGGAEMRQAYTDGFPGFY